MVIKDKNINDSIKIMCASSGLSLAEVARRVGDSPQGLNQRMKQGKIQKDFEYLGKIADSCGFSFRWELIEKETEAGPG